MVKLNSACTLLAASLVGTSQAFVHRQSPAVVAGVRSIAPLRAAVVVGENAVKQKPSGPSPQELELESKPSAPELDLTGVAFSGLKGKALKWNHEDFPKANEIRKVIPAECFETDTAKSLAYLSMSTISMTLCTAVGVAALEFLSPANPLTWPFWVVYSGVAGTIALGLWVLAHECGHGAFSKNKALQDAVGYVIHSSMLVPYFSWQRSHAVHHQYTNNIELGETHVPDLLESKSEGGHGARDRLIERFGEDRGINIFGGLQAFTHLLVGWPAYLLVGATGGTARGKTNHFYPEPLTTPDMPKKELFPGNWKQKVYQSDIGVGAVLAGVVVWAICNGLPEVMALYGGPLLVVNAWLVLYTWLQHTDVDVPHYNNDNHNFVKGALHTIDRPYDELDPWGVIDFLHHKIGTTHVAHHFDSSIPHYNAQAATDAIKENFPEFYLYDPTPIPQALWRICKGTTAVEKRGDRWIWNNENVVDKL